MPCFLKEKEMDSMGPIPFIRSFMCFFNATCYTESQINWNKTENYDFQIFLYNLSIVFESFPKEDINIKTLMAWAFTHPDDAERLEKSVNYFVKISSPLYEAYEMIMSNNETTKIKGIDQLSTILCASKNNDLYGVLRKMAKVNNTRMKRNANQCLPFFSQYLKSFPISPIISGNIYYTPHSNFTDELVRKANYSFVTLDKIRLMSMEWRLHFVKWFENESTNGTTFNKLRIASAECEAFKIPKIAKACTFIHNMLNETTIQSSLHIISSVFGLLESVFDCVNLNKFVPLNSSLDIDNLETGDMANVFAGLVFDPSFQYVTSRNATLLRYSIRMPTNRIDSTKRFKVLDRFWTPAPRRNPVSDLKYYTSGFIMLQEAVDRAFIEMVTDTEVVNVGSSMQIMPTPCYVDDIFIKSAMNLMPFLLVMAWSSTYSSLVKSIVYEKEQRLKEFMLVMGLSRPVHWLAWGTITILITLIPSILTALLLKYKLILEFSSPGVIFLLLFSYIISFISQAFMVSTFFNKANSAAVVSGLLYFVFYIPFVILINVQDDVTYSIYFLTGILSQVSFCNGMYFVAYWEQTKVGVQFSNLFESTVLNLNFGVGHCIIMLWVDVVMYLLITWYVEAVFPGQFGVGRPWYFLVTKDYWIPNREVRKDDHIAILDDADPDTTENVPETSFEKTPDNLKVGISIKNLTKKFPNTHDPAVNNLNLNFYKSQITAFLGHNGAGKTTTISVLTGIFPPTSGTAYIFNLDIRKDIGTIRKNLGLCPQHNILFENLTVEDHIYFYGLLKGMSRTDIRMKIPVIANDVGLTRKLKIKSQELSGGMKRKLSVALAFIGDPKAIFLDEPTAGVDPFARRGIWDLLIKYRSAEKTIVLTTHHMDEADYLSDRIAIISQGSLKCCGSSVFLKRQFGDGYSLILVKSIAAQKELFSDQEHSNTGKYVFQFVRKHVRNASFTEETRTQLTFMLPLDGLKDNGFSNLFRGLDESLDMLNVASYGLSDTSLEKVFLNVANDPSAENAEVQPEELENVEENLDDLTDEVVMPNVVSGSSLTDKLNIASVTKSELKNNSSGNEAEVTEGKFEYELLTGWRLLRQQILALHIKRFHYTKRYFKGFLSEVILPVGMIILMVTLIKAINPFDNQPSMIIHPWLMMPKARQSDLITFYRKEGTTNPFVTKLTDNLRTDLGESGPRCMNRNVFSLEGYPCYSTSGNSWSRGTVSPIAPRSPDCDCSSKGFQQCNDPRSGGPPDSYRLMASSDVLHNLTGYNISDNLLKKFNLYAKKLYGGYQILLPSEMGLNSKYIGDIGFWDWMRRFILNSQQSNTTNVEATYFVTYFQDLFKLSGLRTNFTRIWVNNKGYVSMPSYANIFDNLLLRSLVNSSSRSASDFGIVVASYPFKYSDDDLMGMVTKKMFVEMSLSNFVILALSLIPASFVLFLIEERVSGSKRQQFVSGVNPYVYWLSSFMWDIIKYMVSALLIIVVFIAFNYQSYIGTKNVGAFVAILCGYGFAIIPHMYPTSFMFSNPSTSFVVLSAYNMLVGTITTTTTFLLDQLQVQLTYLKPVNVVLQKLFLIFPQYGLGRGMIDLSFNYMKYNISEGKIDYKPFSWNVIGKNLASFGILFLFWCSVIYLIESGIVHRRLLGKLKNYGVSTKKRNEKGDEDEDVDVAIERDRVNKGDSQDDILRVMDLTKVYGFSMNKYDALSSPKWCCPKTCMNQEIESEKRKVAVNNICFGVKPGECFGLLGVNGAGKTTTFKMLTGEELITRGDATIQGKSIVSDMVAAHKDMGFCPQFDALHDLLTCEEELYLYCRLRGIHPSSRIKATVEWSLRSLSIAPHASKTTNTLSGGNKRKLSTAISLIGNPKVVFMDEPTSGMDAGARRFLWNRIRRLTLEHRAVVLTSHNMEECEVLCHRLAIMVNGQLQCLGSVQQLKSKYGDDYFVTLRMNSQGGGEGTRDRIKSAMEKQFINGIYLKDENFVTLQYRIDPKTYRLHQIFNFFEHMKTTELISDYSVCQTTLDEVFINFAKREDMSKILSATVMKNNSSSSLRKKSYVNDCFEDGQSVQEVLA